MDEQTPQPSLPPSTIPPMPATPIRQTNSLAIASLVSGILGWTLLPWLGSIAAIITGHLARAELRRNLGTQEGDGLAVIGLILGWAMVALSVIGLIIVIVFLGGLAAILAWLGMTGQLK